jgi:hypothetical protein
MAATNTKEVSLSITGVDNKHPDYMKFQSNWIKNQDANDGEEAVKTSIQSRAYLPLLSGHRVESDGEQLYGVYQRYASWFNATGRTVDGLLGLVYRKDPIVELPEELEYMKTDCNTKNQTLDDFSKELFEQVLLKNRVGLLVDFPAVNTKNMNKAQFESLKLRPYFTQYRAECIFNWRMNKINNEYQTTFVTLFETEIQAGANEFENQKIERIRVLDFNEAGYYRQRVYERTIETGESGPKANTNYDWQLKSTAEPKINNTKLKYIPFYCITERGISWDLEYSAINDLSNVNIAHYRNSASYENALILTGNPTPCLVDYTKDDNTKSITLGSSRTLLFGPNGKWGFLSLEGEGIEELRIALQQKEGQMALLGARIIAPEKRQTETAEAASIHRQGEQGVLANIANSISGTITKGLQVAAQWQNVPENEIEEIKYELNTDYLPNQMTFQMLQALLQSWQSGILSDPELFILLKKGEVIEADKTFEEHVEEIENSTLTTNIKTNDGSEEEDVIEEETDEEEEEILEQ